VSRLLSQLISRSAAAHIETKGPHPSTSQLIGDSRKIGGSVRSSQTMYEKAARVAPLPCVGKVLMDGQLVSVTGGNGMLAAVVRNCSGSGETGTDRLRMARNKERVWMKVWKWHPGEQVVCRHLALVYFSWQIAMSELWFKGAFQNRGIRGYSTYEASARIEVISPR
jgi:hypothetical protein